MSNNFGIQYFDENGNLRWDNTSAFTKILGYIDIPLYNVNQLPVSGVINIGENTSLGKPFCFVVPNVPKAGSRNMFLSPSVRFTTDSIIWTYTKLCSAYAEDPSHVRNLVHGNAGDVKLFYGVYGR